MRKDLRLTAQTAGHHWRSTPASGNALAASAFAVVIVTFTSVRCASDEQSQSEVPESRITRHQLNARRIHQQLSATLRFDRGVSAALSPLMSMASCYRGSTRHIGTRSDPCFSQNARRIIADRRSRLHGHNAEEIVNTA